MVPNSKKPKENKAKKYFTLMVVPHDQKKIVNVKMPNILIYSVLGCFVVTIVVSGLLIKNYNNMQKEVIDLKTQEALFRDQREKTFYFASEIENLRKEVNELKNLGVKVKGMSKELKRSSAPSSPIPYAKADKAGKLGQGGPDPLSELSAQRLTQDISSLKNEIGAQKNMLEELQVYMRKQLSYIKITPNRWPLRGWITSRFGWRYFRGKKEFHTGIDIANVYGSSIYAAADGAVVFSGWKGDYGKLVIINHGRGICTYYGHNSVNLVSAGQQVRKGEIIARVGNTGRTTGPHSHYEVRLNNNPINPFKYLY